MSNKISEEQAVMGREGNFILKKSADAVGSQEIALSIVYLRGKVAPLTTRWLQWRERESPVGRLAKRFIELLTDHEISALCWGLEEALTGRSPGEPSIRAADGAALTIAMYKAECGISIVDRARELHDALTTVLARCFLEAQVRSGIVTIEHEGESLWSMAFGSLNVTVNLSPEACAGKCEEMLSAAQSDASVRLWRHLAEQWGDKLEGEN